MLTAEVIIWFEVAPQAWHAKIDNVFMSPYLKHCESDHSLYVLHEIGNTLIVVFYVDYLVIIGNNIDLILGLKRLLATTFAMIDLGILHYFVCLQVFPVSNGIFISQSKYALDVLKLFKMDNCNPCATPFQSGVTLNKECSSLKVDATLYR